MQETKQLQTDARADRLRVPVKGTACSVHAWPNFEPKCQLDLREPAGEARTVRVIALRNAASLRTPPRALLLLQSIGV